jgi:FlaA1/EpsC-like NDP-sugar epimerase
MTQPTISFVHSIENKHNRMYERQAWLYTETFKSTNNELYNSCSHYFIQPTELDITQDSIEYLEKNNATFIKDPSLNKRQKNSTVNYYRKKIRMNVVKNKLDVIQFDEFNDTTVLITGAGGTIGSELVERITAKTIIALDISEYAIYKLQRAIGDRNIHCIVGDASDSKLVDMIFQKYQIDYVFNAAAYKHVDTLEDENNSYSVIKNNILTVVNLCKHAKSLKCLIHVSSDKAVEPSNNMGFTKLWCERIVQHYASIVDSKFKIVRFGNVFGSSGSFVETLNWQMSVGQEITLTDIRMKRYFMTVHDAVTLILTSVHLENLSATYILEMGEEISIPSLVPENYPTKIIGIRPGEKLHESLTFEHEQLEPTSNSMIKRITWAESSILNKLSALQEELNKDKLCLTTLTQILKTITTS